MCCFFFFKQTTAYEMRISDWSSDVCPSDLPLENRRRAHHSSTRSAMRATISPTTPTDGRADVTVAFRREAPRAGMTAHEYPVATRPIAILTESPCQEERP